MLKETDSIKRIKSICFLILMLFAIYLGVGCNQTMVPKSTLSSASPSTEISPVTTVISATPICISSIPSTPPTKAVTQTLSIMPMVTLDPEVSHQEIARLMQTNGNCSAACFWGIIPGMTSFDQAVGILSTLKQTRFVKNEDGSTQYNQSFRDKEGRINFNINFSDTNGTIKSLTASAIGLDRMDVSGKDWLAFRPDNYMKTNGVPIQVLISMEEGPEGRVDYAMTLVYNHLVITYGGKQSVILPQHVLHACLLVEHNIRGFVVEAGEYDEKPLHEDGIIDLAKISGLTTNDFYQTLIGDPKKACFDLDYNKYKSLY
jgi:hypothetical protein